MDKKEIADYFTNIVKTDQDVSAAIAAIRTLMKMLQKSKSETVKGLDEDLRDARDVMRNLDYPATAINSGCELFIRFITLAKLDVETFEECRQIMLKRGQVFLEELGKSREKIVKLAGRLVIDGCKILTHSRSRVVLQTLVDAAARQKRFEVFVTKSAPDGSGERMAKDLEAAGIKCTIILDSSIGYVMEQVDFVMVGAEGVAESGGIINKIGSYTMAMCAKIMNKPFYVLTESFKFSRIFPLNQQDLPAEYKFTANMRRSKDLKSQHPLVDYTPPIYITLLFTDLGILTPSAVSDELLKLYL